MNVFGLVLLTVATASARSVQETAQTGTRVQMDFSSQLYKVVHQFDPDNSSLLASSKAMWNMQGMAECVLHYNALVYNGYGCYCGFGGSGIPVDGIDECCMRHDNCYGDAIVKHGCSSSPLLYFTAYQWDCINSAIFCKPGQSACKRALCECDKKFTMCQARYPKPTHKPSCK